MILPSLCNPAPAPLAMVTHVVTHVVITPPIYLHPQGHMPCAKPTHPPSNMCVTKSGVKRSLSQSPFCDIL